MAGSSTREINVTPLIDILLVLLIIFLVLMPIMARVEPVALPPDEPGDPPPEAPIALKVHADLTVTIDEAARIGVNELAGALRPQVKPSKVVFVDVEDGVPWHEVVRVVDSVRGLARDPTHDEIKVAVRMRETAAP